MWDKVLSPMLLSEQDIPFDDNNFLYEIKFDGMRALIYVSNNEFKIYNRHKKDRTYLFPELKKLQKSFKKRTILDGEIICTKDGLPSFSDLQKRLHLKDKYKIKFQSVNNKVTFICFDILYQDKDLTNLSLIERKEILNKIKDNDIFVKSVYTFKNGIKMFNMIKKLDLEGIVCKNKNSIYEENTRSPNWIKIKNIKNESFYIGGYSYKENSNLFSVYLGEYVNKHLVFVGKVFIKKENNIFNELKDIHSNINPFSNLDKDIQYVKVLKKIKVNYIERTNDNFLRQPFYDIKK